MVIINLICNVSKLTAYITHRNSRVANYFISRIPLISAVCEYFREMTSPKYT